MGSLRSVRIKFLIFLNFSSLQSKKHYPVLSDFVTSGSLI